MLRFARKSWRGELDLLGCLLLRRTPELCIVPNHCESIAGNSVNKDRERLSS